MRNFLLMGWTTIYSLSLSAATFYTIDTTCPLHCYLSSKYQNRIMIENGRIKKIIASDCERLSIQMEEVTGQAFIFAREINPKDTSISIVSDAGVVQDVQINFIERMPEVVILQDPEIDRLDEPQNEPVIKSSSALTQVEEILAGNIPTGYIPCSINYTTWKLKKGIELELKTKLEGPFDVIYIYQTINKSKQPQTLLECELECKGSQWVYLETNTLKPKQTILSIVAVAKYE